MAVCLGPERIHPTIVTEKTDGVDIGRMTITTAKTISGWEASPTFLRFYNALNGQVKPKDSASFRRRIVFYMNNNTAYCRGPLAHERPVSAYFTYDPSKQEVIIEWGTIDPTKGEAKLHDFLNRTLNPSLRVDQGMKLSSGHIARVIGRGEETYLALIDNLHPTDNIDITRDSPMGRLINALHFASFIPISGDGFVRLPAF